MRESEEAEEVTTCSIGVALAERDIAEAHRAVADNDEARQVGELGVLQRYVSREALKAQHQPIICTQACKA